MCRLLPEYCEAVEQHVDHDKGHGRVEMRTVTVFVPPEHALPEGWQPMVKAVVRVAREVWHKRKGVPETSDETAWWISTVALPAQQFHEGIRGHWSVENQNHHVRDTALSEDACRMREQPGIWARLRSIALNCLRSSGVHSIARAIYRNALNFEIAVSMAEGQT